MPQWSLRVKAGQVQQWFIREPFVHFVALGALIFLLYALTGAGQKSADTTIAITADDVTRMRAQFVQQWAHEPDAQAMKGLVENFVREEVLYREALAQGLDKDDIIVRRRLAQKMEFLANEDVRNPSEAEVQSYFASHAADYAAPVHVSLEQVYFSTAKRGVAALSDAQHALAALGKGEVSSGDDFMLPSVLTGQDHGLLTRDFGSAFADAVLKLPTGVWSGPVHSPYGVHVVKVTRRSAADGANLAQVHEKVVADMVNARVDQARNSAYARLRARYVVRVAGEPD